MANRLVIPDDLARSAAREERGDWLAELPVLVVRIAADSDSELHWPEWLKFSVEDKCLAMITVVATLVATIVTLIIAGFAPCRKRRL